MVAFFFPLTDFKTIRVELPAEPVASSLGTEVTLSLALLLLLLGLFLLPKLWRLVRPATRLVEEDWVLIDGSNVMHWQDNAPRLEAVRKVVDLVRARGYAGWKLAGRYLHDGDFAQLLGLEARQVLVVAKGTQADPYLLQTAREFGARIVSNDRFRDWVADHPEIQTPGFLIRGRDVGGEIALEGLSAKPGAVPVNKR